MSNQWFEKQVRIYVARCRNSPTAEAIIHLLKDYESRADQLTTKDRQIAELKLLCERLRVGAYEIYPAGKGFYTIAVAPGEDGAGEAMQVRAQDFIALIDDYYRRNF